MSAFLLLGIGITFSGLLLLCEHVYFRYLRKYLAQFSNLAWCNLLSIDMAESIQGVDNAGNDSSTELSNTAPLVKEESKSCFNPICNTSIDLVTKELQVATERIKILQLQLDKVNMPGEHQVRKVKHDKKQHQLYKRNHRISSNSAISVHNVAEIETVL